MTSKDNWRPGMEVPRAHHYDLAYCDDPNCGIHILAFDSHNKPICEITTTPDQNLRMVKTIQDMLYVKAADKDE